jgi:hypothetical protein
MAGSGYYQLTTAVLDCAAPQAYKYIQRPALPLEQSEAGLEAQALRQGRGRVVSGQPIGAGGRARPSLFPPFPQVPLKTVFAFTSFPIYNRLWCVCVSVCV